MNMMHVIVAGCPPPPPPPPPPPLLLVQVTYILSEPDALGRELDFYTISMAVFTAMVRQPTLSSCLQGELFHPLVILLLILLLLLLLW